MVTDHEMRMEALRLSEENDRLKARIEKLEAALREFVEAYKHQDCDCYGNEMARAYSLADALLFAYGIADAMLSLPEDIK